MLSNHLLLLAGLSAFLTGCYTQLYTQGYGTKALNSEPDSHSLSRSSPSADTLAPGDSSRLATDSLEQSQDSLSNKTIIVNQYYTERPYYRGYAYSEWDTPLISLGFYSSRYRSYNDPYWWHGSGYYHQHRRGYYGGTGTGSANHSGTDGGSYHGSHPSKNQVFTPPPSYPENRKGMRSKSTPATSTPAPAATPTPAPASVPAPALAPKYNASENASSGNASSSSSSGSSSESNESHPAPQKGKRR